MRVAMLERPGEFVLVEEPIPAIEDDEVLLRVGACGVCASELDMFTGLAGHAGYPWFAGHEVAGTVEQVGDSVTDLEPGDSVAAWITVRGYSDYAAVKADHCFKAGDVPLDLALGEPLACAVNAVELAGIKLGDDVVIIGAGFMGHLIHKLVQLRGPRQVIVADSRQDALKRAESFGAAHVVDVSRQPLVETVHDATGGAGADVTIEVTGAQAPLDVVGAITRMSGTVAIVGYHQGEPRSVPLGAWNWMAFNIINAHFRDVNMILGGMRAGMRLLTSGRISLAELVTHRFSLDDIGSAFQTAIAKPEGFVKATVIP
jgi:threonine dehydrogenase-like Zn-dependent dehydrogenase